MVDLMTQFSFRLLKCQALIFFQNILDLNKIFNLLKVQIKEISKSFLKYFKFIYLFEYTETFWHFDNVKFYGQYLIFNIYLIKELASNFIETLKVNSNYQRFIHLFEYQLDVIDAMMGNIDPKSNAITNIQRKINMNFILIDIKKKPLIYAILTYLKCKYHLNLCDYENELIYSEKVLRYIATQNKIKLQILQLTEDQQDVGINLGIQMSTPQFLQRIKNIGIQLSYR
ncbi:unnamed protein product [Paramecium sonneborni]|uniref:Uncharacterized protein n=1 Tax=Paramecium sonneborni TaxID=65129 RepID=A0A8S1RW40_9CILI|nr:unnamed protein product [Paramecium sonneborni]